MGIIPSKLAMTYNVHTNEPTSLGQLRYRVNCLGKLIIQVKVEYSSNKNNIHRIRSEWIDAKPHHVTLTED